MYCLLSDANHFFFFVRIYYLYQSETNRNSTKLFYLIVLCHSCCFILTFYFRIFSTTGGVSASTNNASANAKQSSASTSRQLARSRARIMRTTSVRNNGSGGQGGSGSSSRGTGVIIGSGSSGRSLVTVPAPFVPEELVSQAQVVLQGKSRNVIIRELQVCPNVKSNKCSYAHIFPL